MRKFLAFDYGGQRIGVASGNDITRLATPVTTIANDKSLWGEIDRLINAEEATDLVVGLPLNQYEKDTEQTKTCRKFAKKLEDRTKLPVHFENEAMTSREAKVELKQYRGDYEKADVDRIAAAIILQDYLDKIGKHETRI